MTLRDLRLRKGLTQEELARRIGKTPSYISHLENKKYFPSLKALRRIAEVLEVPAETLVAFFISNDETKAAESRQEEEEERAC